MKSKFDCPLCTFPLSPFIHIFMLDVAGWILDKITCTHDIDEYFHLLSLEIINYFILLFFHYSHWILRAHITIFSCDTFNIIIHKTKCLFISHRTICVLRKEESIHFIEVDHHRYMELVLLLLWLDVSSVT